MSRFLARVMLPVMSAVLHRAPFKSRLNGATVLTRRYLDLTSFSEPQTAILRNGISFNVRLNNFSGLLLYLFGTPDPKVIETCTALLKPNTTFLDIGANYGTVGLLAHHQLGPEGLIHFVEPQEELCRSIRSVLERYGIGNARVHQIGLWDHDGELVLVVPEHHLGAASVHEPEQGESEDQRVPGRDIRAFLDETVADRSFAAKIDVEGAEMKLLPAIFERPSLQFTVFECNVAATRDFVWSASERTGIVLFGLAKNMFSTRLQIIRHPERLHAFHDVLALRIDAASVPDRAMHPKVLGRIITSRSG